MGSSRENSEHAVPVMLSTAIGLQKAEPLKTDENWWMERKLDGFRLIVRFLPDGTIIGLSRNGNDQDIESRLPHLHDLLLMYANERDLFDGAGTILDGELIPPVPVSQAGVKDFTYVTEVMKSEGMRAAMLQVDEGLLCYAVFDALMMLGRDYVAEQTPLFDRRMELESIMDVMYDEHPPELVSLTRRHRVDFDVVSEWIAAGCEGAMLKDSTKPYAPGRSTKNGLRKFKSAMEEDVVIVGFTDAKFGKGGKFFRDGEPMIGAVRFGMYECLGPIDSQRPLPTDVEIDGAWHRLKEVGRMSGMTDAIREMFSDDPESFVGRVAVVKHMGWQTRALRFPQFRGLRTDKDAKECLLP